MSYYNAFISYSHKDCKDIANPIQKALQNIGKPWYKELSTNLKIYRDQTNLSASPGFWPNIEKALNNSDYFILLASPTAAISGWIADEVNVWIKKNYDAKEGIKNIFIVLCEGEIEWDKKKNDFDNSKTNCLPEILYGKFINEPLWIDLKSFIKKNDTSKIINYTDWNFSEQLAKVIGGIINKAPEQIVSKELQRVKKLRNIYIGTGLILVILLIIASYQFLLQKSANSNLIKERKHSDSLAIVANKQRDIALDNLKKFKIEEFNRNIKNGKALIDGELYCDARLVLQNANSTIEDTLYKHTYEIVKEKDLLNQLLDICNKKCDKN